LSVLGSVYSRLTGTPQVLLLHGYEFTGDGDDSSVAKRRVIEWLFETANLVVANSDYVAAQYDDGIVDAVVRPFVDPSRYRVPTDGDAILHVTATRRKGIDVTLAIADRLPNEEFVVVGEASRGVERRLAHRSNVTYRGFVPDMASVYADAKLVLMPSVWAEPYGMVPVEAGVSGIPTLGSGRGGLSESIGHSDLIVDSNDPDDYIDRIDRVLSDYEKYSRIVTERAESRASTERVRRTRRLVARHTSVDL
jgi:glycosyltransferase involved in cell wall biosynthesis